MTTGSEPATEVAAPRAGRPDTAATPAAPEGEGAEERGRRRQPMPPWVPRAIALFWLGLAGLYAVYWIGTRLRTLLVILLVSLFVALAIEPAVDWLSKRGWRRGWATALVFGVFVILAAIFVGAIGSLLVNQVSSLARSAPAHVDDAINWVNQRFHTNLSTQRINQELTDPNGPVRRAAGRLAGNALGVGQSLLGVIFQVATIALFTFYLAADGPRLRRTICSVFSPERQRAVLQAWNLAIAKTGGYVYSRSILAAFSAVATGAFLALLGVPYALALGIWVGLVSQFVPTVGTYLAGALPVIVALINDPLDAIWTLLFIIAYQQVENYLLAPRISARTMNLHPAVAFGAVIAGASILGPAGALLALPVAATIQAFAGLYIRRHEVVDDGLTRDPQRDRVAENQSRAVGAVRDGSARSGAIKDEKVPPARPAGADAVTAGRRGRGQA
jgi:predicted PurR-regulated permease PerM